MDLPPLEPIFEVLSTGVTNETVKQFELSLSGYGEAVHEIDKQQSLLTTYCTIYIALLQSRQRIVVSLLEDIRRKQRDLAGRAQELAAAAAAAADNLAQKRYPDPQSATRLSELRTLNENNQTNLEQLKDAIKSLETTLQTAKVPEATSS